jgi:hypothetical protein
MTADPTSTDVVLASRPYADEPCLAGVLGHDHNCVPGRNWWGRRGWRCVRCHRWFKEAVR